jgi:hypothetical protein
LDRDTKQRNSLKLQGNEVDQKLPAIQLRGKEEVNLQARKSIPNPQPEIDLNYLFDKIDRLSSHVSHNEQRLLQLEQALSSQENGYPNGIKVCLPVSVSASLSTSFVGFVL